MQIMKLIRYLVVLHQIRTINMAERNENGKICHLNGLVSIKVIIFAIVNFVNEI